LGFAHPHLPLTNLYLHSGENVGFTSWYALDPDKRWGFVVFTNSENGIDFAQELLLLYLLTGPNRVPIVVVVAAMAFVVVLGITGGMYATKRLIARRRQKNG
jgi:hypothetical protein